MALLGATLGAFLPVLQAQFINHDDNVYVYENPQVQKGPTPEGARWAFVSTGESNWHPLTWVSHMLDAGMMSERFPGVSSIVVTMNCNRVGNPALLLTLNFLPGSPAFFKISPVGDGAAKHLQVATRHGSPGVELDRHSLRHENRPCQGRITVS